MAAACTGFLLGDESVLEVDGGDSCDPVNVLNVTPLYPVNAVKMVNCVVCVYYRTPHADWMWPDSGCV